MSKTAQRKRTLRQQAEADARRGQPFKSNPFASRYYLHFFAKQTHKQASSDEESINRKMRSSMSNCDCDHVITMEAGARFEQKAKESTFKRILAYREKRRKRMLARLGYA